MDKAQIDASLAQARAHAEASNAEAALDAARRAHAAALQSGDVIAQAEATHCIASVELRVLGEFAAALESARQAAFQFQQAEMPQGECRALATQALAAARLGYYETSVDCALLAVKLCAGLPGDAASVEQVVAHHALGVAMFIGRSYAEASEASQRAIELAHQCGLPVDSFVLHSDLASAEVMRVLSARSANAASTASLDLLAEHLRHCDELLQDAAPPASISIVIGGRSNSIITYDLCKAMLLVWQADLAAAAAQVGVLSETVASSRRPWLEAVVQWAHSELALAEQDLPHARDHAQRMVHIALAHKHEGLAGIGLAQSAHLASVAGDHAAAAQALRELAEREQAARSASLRGRVADVERQLELRSRTRQLRASEAGRAHFQQLALEDGLTGLPNRRHFELQLQDQLDEVRAHGGPACLVMIDVDRFKQINDGHSHNVGDAVLQAIAELMRRGVRDKDFPARLAGDEFVIILRDTGLEAARALTEGLGAAVSQHAWGAIASGLSVSVSLGLAEILPTDTPRTVLSRSDQGMYANKRARAGDR